MLTAESKPYFLPETIMTHKQYDREEQRKSNEPRLIGDIMKEMFQGNSPLYKGYRAFLASKEIAEKGEKADE